MARFTFKLPDIGEGIAEAEIVAWHVAVGDRVEEDQNIADMMTDKATVEMESPVSGVVLELAGAVGDQVAIGAALVVIETGAAGEADAIAAPPTPEQAEVAEQYVAENPGVSSPLPLAGGVGGGIASSSEQPVATSLPPPTPPASERGALAETPLLPGTGRGTAAEGRGGGGPPSGTPLTEGPLHHSASPNGPPPRAGEELKPVLASPAVRARARDLGIDLAQVKTDADRVRHSDLDAYLRYGSAQGYTSQPAAPRPDEAIRIIGIRRRIAENMATSKRSIPHFTYVDEIDVTELERTRADLNANRGDRPKLTFLPLLIVAICRSIPAFPMMNARYDDEAGVVTRHGRVHLGMATQTDAGLTVPVIRDAQGLNVWQLATEIARLAEAARTGRITPAEMGRGTITVTSLGALGGIATTPVINRPEVAILGPNKIIERPVFADDGSDRLRRAKLMNLSISCDHRVVDGWDAASYVQALKRLLETPVLLFAA